LKVDAGASRGPVRMLIEQSPSNDGAAQKQLKLPLGR
jgi:hypothetical protein